MFTVLRTVLKVVGLGVLSHGIEFGEVAIELYARWLSRCWKARELVHELRSRQAVLVCRPPHNGLSARAMPALRFPRD